MGAIRILIADDHKLFRLGLAKLLEGADGLAVIGEAATAAEALEKAVELEPDIILMDVNMPADGGIEATRRIKSALPGTEVLMLTMYATDEFLLNAVKAGASGYLLKDIPLEELVKSIKAVARGEVILSPFVVKRILREFSTLQREKEEWQQKASHGGLSAREKEILSLIAAGESNRAIAARLCISEKTARHHTSNIYRKLNIGHRAQAALEAVRLGLISPAAPSQ